MEKVLGGDVVAGFMWITEDENEDGEGEAV